MKVGNLLLKHCGQVLEVIVKDQAGFAQAFERLFKLRNMIRGSRNARGLINAQQDIVERGDIARHG